MNPLKTSHQLFTKTNSTITTIFKHSIKPALGFFLFWYTIISLILALKLWLPLNQPLTQAIIHTKQIVQQHFPNNSAIIIKPDSIELIHNHPSLIIPAPTNSFINGINNLAIVDPSAQPKDIYNYSTLLLANQDSLTILLSQDPNQSRTIPFSEWEQTGTITKQSLLEFIDLNATLYNTIKPIIPVLLTLFMLIGFTLSRLFIVLIYTLATQAIGQLMGKHNTFINYIKLGLHTVVGAEIIFQYQKFIFPAMPSIFLPLGFLLLTTLTIISLGRK